MKLFYFQAKKDLERKQATIDLLRQANGAMSDEVKSAYREAEKFKCLYENEIKENKRLLRQLKKKA